MACCTKHWDQLKKSIEKKGMKDLIAKNGEECAQRMTEGKFEPLMGALMSIITFTMDNIDKTEASEEEKNKLKMETIIGCPLCIVNSTKNGQEIVDNWIDGSTTDMLMYAIENNLVEATTH